MIKKILKTLIRKHQIDRIESTAIDKKGRKTYYYFANLENIQLPDSWYIKSVKHIIKMNKNIDKVYLFSDSNDLSSLSKEISKLIPTKVANVQTAIGSIMYLSKCDYIICSKSTFSMWAAFLGESICLWPKKYNLKKFIPIEDRFLFIDDYILKININDYPKFKNKLTFSKIKSSFKI